MIKITFKQTGASITSSTSLDEFKAKLLGRSNRIELDDAIVMEQSDIAYVVRINSGELADKDRLARQIRAALNQLDDVASEHSNAERRRLENDVLTAASDLSDLYLDA